jgi:dienelactone hydrolase
VGCNHWDNTFNVGGDSADFEEDTDEEDEADDADEDDGGSGEETGGDGEGTGGDGEDDSGEEDDTGGGGGESDEDDDEHDGVLPCIPRFLPKREEAVSFATAGMELEGTLTLPSTDSCRLHPAAVLVHGSGPVGRDSVMAMQFPNAYAEISVFVDIAQSLADAGFVVLRYDKRTCTPQWGGCDNAYPDYGWDIGMDDYLDDANAALDYLASRPEVASDQLVYVGHSQGAQFAPVVLATRDDVQAGVMLAGGYFQLPESLAWQLEARADLLRIAGYDEDEVEAALAPYWEGVGQLDQLRAGTYEGEWILGSPTHFWAGWMFYIDIAPGLAYDSDRPLLAVSGDYDYNVAPEETERWGEVFAQVPHDPGHMTAVLPCVGHALSCVTNPDPASVGPEDVQDEVHESVHEAILSFLQAAFSQ